MDIKFFLQKFIDRGVEGEGKSGRLTDAEFAVQIKTPWAFYKVINPPPA
jgi:hypothetical protein